MLWCRFPTVCHRRDGPLSPNKKGGPLHLAFVSFSRPLVEIHQQGDAKKSPSPDGFSRFSPAVREGVTRFEALAIYCDALSTGPAERLECFQAAVRPILSHLSRPRGDDVAYN